MPSPDEVVKYMDEVASRALGGEPDHAFDPTLPEPQGIGEYLATAIEHKDAGLELQGPTRLAAAKGALLRALRPITTSQTAFNRAVLAIVQTLNHNLGAVQADVDHRLGRAQAALASGELVQRENEQRILELQARLDRLENALGEAGSARLADHTELAVQRARVDVLLQEARRRLPEPFDQEQLEAMAKEADAWLAPLYADLEEAFRGSRDEILESQKGYLPDVLAMDPPGPVVDVGCGRGEWLELLAQNGVEAYGVDTNEEFVRRNRDRGLDVRHGDAVEHLAGLAPSSVAAVTGFHIVEHLDLPTAVRLLDAALVALRPGGAVVFETPNPTNVVVGASSFYLDPTHRSPLHPLFLEFLVQQRGFNEVEVRYLHPNDSAAFSVPDDASPQLRRLIEHVNWAFFGPMDFAVIGRKAKPSA